MSEQTQVIDVRRQAVKQACKHVIKQPVKRAAKGLTIALLAGFGVMTTACSTTTPVGNDPLSLPSESNSLDVFKVSREAEQAYEQSRFIEAVKLYQQIVEKVPNDADAWFRLANTYVQQGVYGKAVHAYERSLQSNQEQPKAWFNLSTAYLLYAQEAMRSAHEKLRPQDPARVMIEHRLTDLESLVHGRIEESVSPARF